MYVLIYIYIYIYEYIERVNKYFDEKMMEVIFERSFGKIKAQKNKHIL